MSNSASQVSLPRKLYRISEISAHTGLSRQTLHTYSTLGLITETQRTPGGHRLYEESVFTRIAEIKRLASLGMTLEKMRLLLSRKES